MKYFAVLHQMNREYYVRLKISIQTHLGSTFGKESQRLSSALTVGSGPLNQKRSCKG